MGSRTNYVIKNGDKLTYYHNRWRAYLIAADLYLGKMAFLTYLSGCDIVSELRDHLWMEGFVMMDAEKKQLGFWSWEFDHDTSVIRYYLSALQEKWPGWQIIHFANEMYDAEPLLGIDYVSQQEIPAFKSVNATDIINDPLSDEYPYVLFIIRQHQQTIVAKMSDISLESIICYGEDIVPLLKARPPISMPIEGQTDALDLLLIDADNKQLIINNSILGIWETMAPR